MKKLAVAFFTIGAALSFMVGGSPVFTAPLTSQAVEDKSCGELAGGVKICENWLYDQCEHHSQCY